MKTTILRPYQIELANKALSILNKLNIVYLSIEMRVGKTLIALYTCHLSDVRKVLFVTKKKAIPSIQSDFSKFSDFCFSLDVINFESLHKISDNYDIVIIDEAHSLGAYPKPSGRTKSLKAIIGNTKIILLSGTPSPESYSQLFHQFWISAYSPFCESTFYKWAKAGYVHISEKFNNGYKVNDYSKADSSEIMKLLSHYFISYTRKEAGFSEFDVLETVVNIPCPSDITAFSKILLSDYYYKFKDEEEVLCDTAAKLQSKIHQVFSGTCKTESGNVKLLSSFKADYIKSSYHNQKIAIFYKFIGEYEILKETFNGEFTENPIEFNSTNRFRVFLSQLQSGSMGISLDSADVLLYYNIDFSAVTYWQSRARLQSLDRTKPAIVHWIFSENGIEKKIYNIINKKKDYTVSYFKKDFMNGTGHSI